MNKLTFIAACVAAIASSQMARALTISGSVGGAPTGVNHLNFDDLVNGATGTMVTAGPDGPVTVSTAGSGQVAQGSVGGVYAAPCLSGLNGQGFASQTTAGPDTTPYLSAGGGGSVKLDFGVDQQYFGLLWGSIDGYNTLSFYDSSNVLIDTVVGGDVLSSPNGDQGVNGTLYVNINTTRPFRYAVASSSSYAFEFDNVSYSQARVGVPDSGSTVAMLATGLIGMGFAARRRSAK